MKRSLIILTILAATAGVILVTLDRLMGNPNLKTHGFNRTFKNLHFTKEREYKLNKNFYNIAGIKNDILYLGNHKPGEVLIINTQSDAIRAEKIDLPGNKKLESAFETTIDYPNIYISGANARLIITGNLSTNKHNVYELPAAPILSAAVINEKTAVIRSADTASLELEFRKINYADNIIEAVQKVAPVKNSDIFAYDGLMLYDRKLNQFAYVNYYCNGIAKFDTELKHITRRKSIDTMNVPKVAVAHLKASITHKAPPLIVNKGSYLYDGVVYVNSALIADNENYQVFSENTVIDTYGDGYKGSFYIPVPPREMKQFALINDNRIAVLLSDRLEIYSIK